MTASVENLELYSPLANFACFIEKNKKLYHPTAVSAAESLMRKIHESLFGLFGVFAKEEALAVDVFLVVELQNHLEIYARITGSDEIKFIHRKFNALYTAFIAKHLEAKPYYDYQRVLRYVRKFIAAPPVALHTTALKLINASF